MDKVAANNHFVSMRKEVKKAKAMVAQKLIRKISKLKQEKEKATDDAEKQKIDSKIEKVYGETKIVKVLDSYNISKQATLKPGADVWNKVVDTSQSSEERLIALVICKNNIQRRVKTFREDNKDLDEWINEYIEYREKKREIKEGTGRISKRQSKAKSASKSDKASQKHIKAERTKTKPNKYSDSGSRTRRQPSLDSSQGDADVEDKVKKAHDHEHLHPSWDAKRREKDMVKMALEGKFKSQKIDLTGES